MRNLALPNTGTLAEIEALMYANRPSLGRVVAFINGKGGAGKTTCTANIGATAANMLGSVTGAKRVLCIELDGQGNLGLDLGFTRTEHDDDGASILAVGMGTGQFNIIRNVRPNLDVIPGGLEVPKLSAYLKVLNEKDRKLARLGFSKALADLAHEYEWIFIDCPPLDEEIQVLGLVAARWMVIPAQFDRASRFGLEGVSIAYEEALNLNPDLDLLGVLMFGFERREVRPIKNEEGKTREIGQRSRVRQKLREVLEGIESNAPIFDAVISNARVVAEECREVGIVSYEMADQASSEQWRKDRRARGEVVVDGDVAEALATDYQAVTVEIIRNAREREVA